MSILSNGRMVRMPREPRAIVGLTESEKAQAQSSMVAFDKAFFPIGFKIDFI